MKKITENNYLEIINWKEISNIEFIWIDFSWLDLGWKQIHDCSFEKCNFSNSKFRATSLNNITFKKCKIMWINFNEINHNLSNFDFFDCNLILCSFYSGYLNVNSLNLRVNNTTQSTLKSLMNSWKVTLSQIILYYINIILYHNRPIDCIFKI